MEWKTIFRYSILAISFHSISIPYKNLLFHVELFSVFHSILPYQGKFKSEATCNLLCTFATLSVPLQVVTREGKQHGTMHLIQGRI